MARKPKINVQHILAPPRNVEIAIFPIGLYCNLELQKAKREELIEVYHEWRHETRYIKQISRFKINSQEFSFIMRIAYGRRMTVERLLSQWRSWAVVEGYGAKGISEEECIVCELGRVDV